MDTTKTATDDRTGLLIELLPSFFLEPPDLNTIQETLRFMNVPIKDSPPPDLELEVKKEFARFLRVPGENYLPPYESFWVLIPGKDDPFNAPILYSETTQQVADIYEKLDITQSETLSEPPDHIGFELSAYFTLRSLTVPEINDVKIDFICNHFMRWVPEYLKKLSHKEGLFYPAIASYILKNIQQ